MLKNARAAAIAASALLTVGLVTPASADPVLEVSGGVAGSTEDVSAGWSFTTTAALEVTALDAFDLTPSDSANVRLYDASGTTLASATITSSDPQEGSPTAFFTQAIAPILLAANTTYFIAEDAPDGGGTDFLVETNSPTTSPLITYDGGVAQSGLGNPTSNSINESLNPAFFGPDFDAVPVPEPVSITLLGIGVAGLGIARRRQT